jgi:hypothetical protein
MNNTAIRECCQKCKGPFYGQYLVLNGGQGKYHYECFTCAGCTERITGSFCPHGQGEFYHPECFEELYAPRCFVCKASLSGKEFLKHMYFTDDGGYCKHHEQENKSCFSCSRKEPHDAPFVRLEDGRFVCTDCISSSIFENVDAKAIYLEVVEFMRLGLGFEIPSGMAAVPVLAVDLGCLNNSQRINTFGHHDATTTICRGLTLSTTQTMLRYRALAPGAPAPWGAASGKGGTTPNGGQGQREFRFAIPSLSSVAHTLKNVTAVLVLSGLPRHVMAAILAHEAMHVWCKLSSQMTQCELPHMVEEGLCQLVSFKYLEYIDAQYQSQVHMGANYKNSWEYKLVRYNKYLIEADTTPVYGEGFRRAGEAHAAIGLTELLNFVSEHKLFPVT